MLDQLKSLKNRLKKTGKLTIEQRQFLAGIQTLDDLRRPYRRGSIEEALAYDAAIALGASEIEALVITGEAEPNSLTKITINYHDGEYLSAYEAFGEQAKLLEKIGLAVYISGWGYRVKDSAVKTLGTEFLYHQAVAYAKPAMDRAAQTAKLAADLRKAKFDQAARTGQPVILDQYTDDCNDPREECSLDEITVYAMPNGQQKTVRSHTW